MEMRQDTKIALAWELLEARVPKGHIAKRLEISRRTVIRWAQGFQGAGSLTAFLDGYHQAKRGPRRKRKRGYPARMADLGAATQESRVLRAKNPVLPGAGV